jgi:hypothetical protein
MLFKQFCKVQVKSDAASENSVLTMNRFKCILIDMGVLTLYLLINLMPLRVRDYILDRVFPPIRDTRHSAYPNGNEQRG